MKQPWEPATAASLQQTLTAAASTLTVRGLPTEYYLVPGWDGYAPVIGADADVHCLDIRWAPALRHPGYTSHALFQVFDPGLPHLAVFVPYDRRDQDGHPDDDPSLPRVGARMDHKLAFELIPVLDTVLNPLDPTGHGRSLQVGCYHGHSNIPDLLVAPFTGGTHFRNFRRRGQHAIIWVDYHVPLAESAVRLALRVLRAPDVHLIHRTGTASSIRVPLRTCDGTIVPLSSFSDALDTGVALAQRYLRRLPFSDLRGAVVTSSRAHRDLTTPSANFAQDGGNEEE